MNATSARHSVRDSAFWQVYGRNRYAVLFYCLLVMLVALPAASALGLPQFAIKLLLATCLLAAAMPNAVKGRRTLLFSAVLVLIVLRFVAEPDQVPINFGPILVVYGLAGLAAAA